MTVTFDENVQERDCVVLFKFNSEFNVCVTVIEIVQKLSCSGDEDGGKRLQHSEVKAWPDMGKLFDGVA